MTDIVFHIGLPKTATTTLQEQVFPLHPGFVGLSKRGRCLSGCGKEVRAHQLLLQSVFAGERPAFRDSAHALSRHLFSLQKSRQGDAAAPLLFSVEGLSRVQAGNWGYPVVGGVMPAARAAPWKLPPVIAFLGKFRGLWEAGRVRVLFTVRSQPQWLGSLYAQVSGRIYGAGQRDFEHQVLRAVSAGNTYLQWADWVEAIESAVGRENVCVLPTEEVGSLDYWRELSSFLEFPELQPEALMGRSGSIENRRSSGGNSWQVRPLRSRLFSHEAQRGKALSTHPLGHRAWVFAAKRGDDIVGPLVRWSDRRFRGDQVVLTDRLRQAVADHVSESNQRLSVRIGRDLGALGYPV